MLNNLRIFHLGKHICATASFSENLSNITRSALPFRKGSADKATHTIISEIDMKLRHMMEQSNSMRATNWQNKIINELKHVFTDNSSNEKHQKHKHTKQFVDNWWRVDG